MSTDYAGRQYARHELNSATSYLVGIYGEKTARFIVEPFATACGFNVESPVSYITNVTPTHVTLWLVTVRDYLWNIAKHISTWEIAREVAIAQALAVTLERLASSQNAVSSENLNTDSVMSRTDTSL